MMEGRKIFVTKGNNIVVAYEKDKTINIYFNIIKHALLLNLLSLCISTCINYSMTSCKKAYQAQEAFGKGLVSGIEESGQSIEDLQQDIINLGEALGGLAADVNNFASDTIAAFDRIGKSAAVQGLLDVFDALVRGVGFVITGELVPSMDQATARLAGEDRRKNE